MRVDADTATKLALLQLPIVFFGIFGLLAHFHGAVSRRYRGRSLDYLSVAYFLGQIIVCLVIWLGCWLSVARFP